MPVAAFVVGIVWVPLKIQTAVFSIVFAGFSSISITAGKNQRIIKVLGYHRLWSHRAYSAHPGLQVFFATFGASAGLYSIIRWCSDHRAHHQYLDSDRDPYSARRGLFHAHYGWLLVKPKPGTIGYVNIQDLLRDNLVMWQYENYPMLFFLMAFVLPTAVSTLLFNDLYGGIVYASCLRLFFIQQSMFCINSLAHWVGEKPFSGNTPCDNFLVALITYGEGYHNFHHEFPMDYRNGIRWMDYDPTKWFIWLCAYANLASGLKTFPENEIEKSRFQRLEHQLEIRRQKISWGTKPEELPAISIAQFTDRVRAGSSLIIINDVAHDVSEFMHDHPGGIVQMEANIGRDCTKLFYGGIYMHSNAAVNLLSTMRVARIVNTACQVKSLNSYPGSSGSDGLGGPLVELS
ncbi:acyl-CoA desaturase [Aspergillus aculeatinus CBS 121060]|uniref:Stearoyl-CoA desaturase n=1 Tax=Aspergillus aculeatinus CBS 121060 TaxID=1448322 RepID=A0ACD1H1W0_9EURO|nr:stearoyl-CoA desaturase [Aspergillus aculeatinus CBS 121060]RAH67590.1 stearoyl-CoA desaturase [Aspergillus aculeatinus CBS 121060]